MALKFDGKMLKDGSRTIANLSSDILREGSSSGGKALGNIKSGDIIRAGNSSGGSSLCNVKDGKNIREGNSAAGSKLVSIDDAAKKIGATSKGPSTALVWYFFAR